jgi:hypothetical protein
VTSGETAERWASAPNEENLFLLPDRLCEGANAFEIRSSRLT